MTSYLSNVRKNEGNVTQILKAWIILFLRVDYSPIVIPHVA